MDDIHNLLRKLVDEDSAVRSHARDVLKPLLESQISTLFDAVGSCDVEVRRAAAEALFLLPASDQRVELLGKCLAADDPATLACACWVVEQDGAPSILQDRIGPLVAHEVWYVRQAAIEAIAAMPTVPTETWDSILRCATDEVWQVRSSVANALAKQCIWDNAVRAVFESLATDGEHEVRKSAIESLSRIQPDISDVKERLRQVLLDVSYDVRIAACNAVALYGRAAQFAIPNLQQCLRTSDPELTQAAQRAIQASVGQAKQQEGRSP